MSHHTDRKRNDHHYEKHDRILFGIHHQGKARLDKENIDQQQGKKCSDKIIQRIKGHHTDKAGSKDIQQNDACNMHMKGIKK